MINHRLALDVISGATGRITYLHNKKATHSGAFVLGERGALSLRLPRYLGCVAVRAVCRSDATGDTVFDVSGIWESANAESELYTFKFALPKVGLYFFTLILESAAGIIYAYPDGELVRFSNATDGICAFQLSVSEFKYKLPEKYLGGVIYHVFVDRFMRGGEVLTKKGARLIEDWTEGIPEFPPYRGAPLKNNTFYGGTLWGIREKLPYIASLGVKLIYLSPIFDSPSNHKYDTADYMHVDSMFGGDEALSELIKDADTLGIGVILDGVFNHTGDDSIYFDRYSRHGNGAYTSKNSPYYTWYEFTDYPDKYTCWWGIDILPRINPDVPQCREYFTGSGGVIEKYAKMGIAGLRLDVVDELSDDFVKDIKKTLERSNGESVLYGEVWEDASNKIAYGKRKAYYSGDELDGVMNYPLRRGIISFLNDGGTEDLRYALTDVINNAPERIRNMQMNLLGTHDTERILTVLGDVIPPDTTNDTLSRLRMNESEKIRATKKLKSAYTVLATLPGIPTIFYGDEAGLEGYHDPFNRMPYPWGRENAELLQHYRTIGKIRGDNEVYRSGDFKLLILTPTILAFARYKGKDAFVTVVNNSEHPIYASFDKKATALISDKEVLQPHTAEIFKVKTGANLHLNTESTF